jgi:hypothetical protein
MLRFAVHRPGYPVASPRSHRMPCGEIPGSVNVGIADKGAGATAKVGLSLARLPVHMPAGAATLTRKRRVNLLDSPLSLLFQAADQHSPAGCKNLPVQPRLLAHVLPRIIGGALGTTRHMANAQMFDTNHVESTRQISADLLAPVLMSIGLPDLKPGNREFGFGTAVAPAFRASKPTLQQAQAPLARHAQLGTVQQLARRQGRAHYYSAVYADDLTIARSRNRLGKRSKRHMPTACAIHGNPERLHSDGNCAGPAEPNPAAFGDEQLSRLPTHSAYMIRFNRNDTESFVTSGFPPCRPTVRSGEVVLHRLTKVAERLLLHRLAADSQPWVFVPRNCELLALLQISRRTRPPRTPPRVLLTGEIPHEPGVRAMLSQYCFVGSRRVQAIARHTKLYRVLLTFPGR